MADVLDRNFDFATNGTVTAAGLHSLIDNTDIYAGLISTQEEKTTIGTADLLLVADSSSTGSPQMAPNRTTVYNLFDDALTGGTYANAQLSGNLTYGTATGQRTISTSATITTGTIATLNSTTGTIATLNSTTGTITNLSTTLAGDLAISQGTATLGTTGATAATYGTTNEIPRITVDAKGRITAASTVTAPVGFRNRLINGDMRIDQRSSGSAYAITSSLYGSCDRWASLAGANGVWTQQRVTTGSTDFPFATRVQRVAGSTSTAAGYIGQVIETTNCQDLAGQSVTLSFYATAGANFSATSSLIGVQLDIGTGSDEGWTLLNQGDWDDYSGLINATQAITTTRTRYSFTATVPSGINEIAVRFYAQGTGTAGANDWFQITGVQLEAGSTATDFERRPIGTELALCKRYYYELPSGATNAFLLQGGMQSTTNTLSCIYHPVEMRSAPTIGVAGVASDYYVACNSTTTVCTSLPVIIGMSSKIGSALSFGVTAGASVPLGYASWAGAATSTAKISFVSELA